MNKPYADQAETNNHI